MALPAFKIENPIPKAERGSKLVRDNVETENEAAKGPSLEAMRELAKAGYLQEGFVYDVDGDAINPGGIVFYTTNFNAKLIERRLFQNGYSAKMDIISPEKYFVYVPEEYRAFGDGENWYLWERKQAEQTSPETEEQKPHLSLVEEIETDLVKKEPEKPAAQTKSVPNEAKTKTKAKPFATPFVQVKNAIEIFLRSSDPAAFEQAIAEARAQFEEQAGGT